MTSGQRLGGARRVRYTCSPSPRAIHLARSYQKSHARQRVGLSGQAAQDLSNHAKPDASQDREGLQLLKRAKKPPGDVQILSSYSFVYEASVPPTLQATEQRSARALVYTRRSNNTHIVHTQNQHYVIGPKERCRYKPSLQILQEYTERSASHTDPPPGNKQIGNEQTKCRRAPKENPHEQEEAPRAGEKKKKKTRHKTESCKKLSRHPELGIERIHQTACFCPVLSDRSLQLSGERALEAHGRSPASASDAADYLSGFLDVEAWTGEQVLRP